MKRCYALVHRRCFADKEFNDIVDVSFENNEVEAAQYFQSSALDRCFIEAGAKIVDLTPLVNPGPIRPETVPAPYNEPITALYVRLT
jgi:hypothetical protein